jgi:NAD(P)-dependent dehydrogenase (short-subunit alcohol dehydrogenase family)
VPLALITGVRRIGGAIARELAARGADVALGCHTSREAADETAAAIAELGRRAVVLEADLAGAEACRRLVDAAADALGGLSVVVLAASRFDKVPFDAIDVGVWDRALAVDLSGSFHCARAAVPHLRRAGGGHIVLFADWVAASGRPRYRGYLPYYVAKRAVVALGEALAHELAADDIRVHVVAPGPIVPAAGTTEADAQAVMAATPLGRWGGEGEVAARVADLVTTRFVTGDTVRIDGGRHLR